MSPAEIALFTIIVFLFIIAIYQFVLLKKSHVIKQQQEPKKIEYKDIVNITPEFKFETSGLNGVDIPSIKELMKPATDLKTLPDLDNKTDDIKDEIPKAEPEIIETPTQEDTNVPIELMEDISGLKLEDILIEEKKGRRKAIKKNDIKKPSLKEEVIQKESPGEEKKQGKKRKKKGKNEEPVGIKQVKEP